MTSHNPPAPVRLYATASKCLLTLTTLTLTLPGGRFTGLAEITPSVQGSATVEGPPLDLGGLGTLKRAPHTLRGRTRPGPGTLRQSSMIYNDKLNTRRVHLNAELPVERERREGVALHVHRASDVRRDVGDAEEGVGGQGKLALVGYSAQVAGVDGVDREGELSCAPIHTTAGPSSSLMDA
ncbi:hypothetical protein EUX98_g3731 [Antrodiella citrinella]|uniref:Uncharacterized protein n=1 Tax=Antrodiella citrinella TaxID=2447956 RepID=A0A4S4MYK1_9APHY|nr:hypothetical protein EUX98_g3731 [Antrodiella citrinella]